MPQIKQHRWQRSKLSLIKMDVTNEQQVESAIQLVIERFERIDVLVNCAGYGLLAAVEEGTDAEVKANYEVNVFGY